MNGPDGWRTRLYYSNMSGNAFVDQMDPTTDKVGLATYGQSQALNRHSQRIFRRSEPH